jgi:hypothetical protein
VEVSVDFDVAVVVDEEGVIVGAVEDATVAELVSV